MKNARLILASLSGSFLISMGVAYAAEQVAPRTISDITALLDQYQPDPKLAEQNRARAAAEPPANLSGSDLGRFFNDRAWAAQAIGDSRRQIADLRKAVELGGGNESQAYQQDLSNALLAAGNLLEGMQIRERLSQNTSPGRLLTLNKILTDLYLMLGDQSAARDALKNSEAGYAKVAMSRSPLEIAMTQERVYFIHGTRANFLELEGKYDQAELALRNALRAAQTHWDRVEDRIAARTLPPGRTPQSHREISANHLDVAEIGLSRFLIDRNRLDEAELLVRNVLRRILPRLGRDNVGTARVMTLFADNLKAQGRYHEALQMAQAAVDTYGRAGATPASNGLAKARRTLGSVLVSQSRWVEAVTAYEDMRAGLASDPENLAALANGDASWGLALVKAGRAGDAVSLLGPRVEQDRGVLGESHPIVALTRGVLGMALTQTRDRQRALAEFEAATSVLLKWSSAEERSAAQAQILRYILESYIALLIEIRGSELERTLKVDATAQAFLLADVSRARGVQRALTASAARAAAGDSAIADLMRREQDLSVQTGALYTYLFNQLSLPPNEQLPRVIGDMRARLQTIGAERSKLQAALQQRFPRYADLVHPRAATLQEARAALSEGEVLVSLLITDDRTYVWAVPKNGAVAFNAASVGQLEVNRTVTQLRRSLDPGEVQLERLPEFDLAQAARLYQALLKPVEEAWQGAHSLTVVANGALAQLPFGILPVAAVAAPASPELKFGHYKNVPWLIRQVAVTQLPTVNTLVTLRALPAGNPARSAFAGFGDPQFGVQAPSAAQEQVAMNTRNLGIRRVTQAALKDGSAPASYISYGALPSLPDTREEILAIAAALGADASKDVFLGARASKQNVKATNLTQRRIVAFATHGLIPGDFPNLEQPALALASPDGKAETGLLTLEEILGLKLDADWVVLSACNTAAGDGAGAEAISGLGRGFFYAGSRALLVTHWPVETRSARQLVTTLFERYAGNPTLSRAEALKQASLAVMEDSAKDASGRALFSYAHPLFWAPYALVGDGGR